MAAILPPARSMRRLQRLSQRAVWSWDDGSGVRRERRVRAGATSTAERIEITAPDDFHLHLRQGVHMSSAVCHSVDAGLFRRGLIMPNTKPPVRNVDEAVAYGQQILQALETHPLPVTARTSHFSPEHFRARRKRFKPLMTLYLTDATTIADVEAAAAMKEADSGVRVVACKLYPANATTNSAAGVTDVMAMVPVFEAMREAGLLLLIHGEMTGNVDIFDRERLFVENTMRQIVERVPGLRVVMEHITTSEAAAFVAEADDNVGATITPQHLLLNRNAIFAGGINPHHFCLPILKREKHREALLAAVSSGSKKFFMGTDSAPHTKGAKECACGCAGIFSATAALPLYATAFEEAGALHHLEAFAGHNGADFYQLPRNEDKIALMRQTWRVPDVYEFGGEEVVPLWAGKDLHWAVEDVS